MELELKARYREVVHEEATNLEYTVEVASSDGVVVVARGLLAEVCADLDHVPVAGGRCASWPDTSLVNPLA